jgi:hypothetical protein
MSQPQGSGLLCIEVSFSSVPDNPIFLAPLVINFETRETA